MKKITAGLFLIFSVAFLSCDQDFNTVGADLVGDEHFDFDSYNPSLKAYSIRTNEVQTNNLPINPLGFYKNPFFGTTGANFVTQVSLVNTQPKFGTNVQVENVTLYVPYFSGVESVNEDGSKVYSLDSIYGSKDSKIKLSVYENGYVLNNFDPNTDYQNSQRYYNDGTTNGNNVPIDFDNLKRGHDGAGNSVQGGTRLNDSPDVAQNDQFSFKKEEIVIYKTKFNTTTLVQEYVDDAGNVLPPADQTNPAKWVVKERLAPGMYLTLNKEFFKKKVLEASKSDLFNTSKFREYFKGLFFKTELVGAEGAMAMLNFNNARLNINYSSVDDGAVAGTLATSKAYTLALGTNSGGITVSLQNFAYADNLPSGGGYNTGLSDAANTVGSATFGQNNKLYVKGGKGSVVYMDVFGDADVLGKDGLPYTNPTTGQPGNGVPDELDQLRLKGWLINDAYLEFYVDQTIMSGADQVAPERLYLFDATNQRVLFDYSVDATTSSNSKRNKLNFSGILQRDVDKKAKKYKINITQHITNLINSTGDNAAKNVRLGLCVTESIAITSNYFYKNPLDLNNTPTVTTDDIKFFPVASVLAQQGVVLYGTNPDSANADKKLKLTIHYTKPN